MLGEIVPVLAVLMASALMASFVRVRYPRTHTLAMWASLALHMVAAFLQLWLVYRVYRTGDALMYTARGREIALLLRQDLWQTSWEVVKMFLQQEYFLSIFVDTPAASTGSMIAIVAALHLVLGDSMVATCLALAVASWAGKVLLYDGLQRCFDDRYAKHLLFSTLLVPSVIYWSAGIVKEGVALIGLGIAVRALAGLRERRSLTGWASLGWGCLLIGVLKAHILMSMVVAVGAWMYFEASRGRDGTVRIRPRYVVLAAVVAVGGSVAFGELFPRYALDEIGESAATLQFYGTRTYAGSAYSLGSSATRSIAGQVAYAPLALLTSLFRPFPFEVSNPQMAMNALETTALLGACLFVAARRAPMDVWRQLSQSPFLVFCIVFTLTFGVGTGLVSNSLGTLSRYRMPMMPFYAAFVLILAAPSLRRASAARRRPVPWVRPADRVPMDAGARGQTP